MRNIPYIEVKVFMLTVLPYLSDFKVNCSLGNGEYLTISFNDFGEGVWATWLSGAAAIIGEEEMNADIKCKQKNTNYFSGLIAACSGGEILKKKVTFFRVGLLQYRCCKRAQHRQGTRRAQQNHNKS